MRPVMNSKRKFTIYLHDGLDLNEVSFPLCDLLRNEGKYKDTELFYSLLDDIDLLLDLKGGESMYHQPNRDNPKSKALICRTH